MPTPNVLMRGEETAGRASVTESVMPAGSTGPPLHKHDFDEAFYVLDGELTMQVGDDIGVLRAGEFALAAGGVAHTIANPGEAAVRFLIVCTPAGFERELARRAARRAGVEPPDWALQEEVPAVTRIGPPIGG